MSEMSSTALKPNLREIALVFLRLGATAFGGPAAHIALMEEEVVRRKKWLTHDEFLDLLGATNLIPGPNSTEMAIHVGYKMGGIRGLVTAGVSFIVPAFLIVWAIAWSYVKYGALPEIQSVFLGVKPVILAVIAVAILSLAKTAIKDKILGLLAALALGLYLYSGNEILILFVVAILNLLIRSNLRPPKNQSLNLFLLSSLLMAPLSRLWAQVTQLGQIQLENIFLYFAKVGSILFGSGYVLIAFLQNDLVEKYHWINQQQLLDAIAVGQFTPGPVFTTATFIGFLISGHSGAVLATLGIFTPAFIFVALSAPLIPRLRRSKLTAPILDGLNVASLSLMGGAALTLTNGVVNSTYGLLTFIVSLFVLLKYKINSAWLILVAAIFGCL